jgi:hypothetical protein
VSKRRKLENPRTGTSRCNRNARLALTVAAGLLEVDTNAPPAPAGAIAVVSSRVNHEVPDHPGRANGTFRLVVSADPQVGASVEKKQEATSNPCR